MESGPKKIHFARSFIVKSPQISTKEFNINEKISCFQNRNPNFRYPRWSSEIIAFERVCNSFYNQIWQYILTIFRYCIYVEFLRKSIEWCVFERVNYYTAVVVCAQNWQIWRLESRLKKIVLALSDRYRRIVQSFYIIIDYSTRSFRICSMELKGLQRRENSKKKYF